MREQNSGANVLLRKIFFLLETVGADEGALLRERVAGACCGDDTFYYFPGCPLTGALAALTWKVFRLTDYLASIVDKVEAFYTRTFTVHTDSIQRTSVAH